MNDLIAKPVLKNKFWIVESNGSKIGTIQAVENGGYVYVDSVGRKRFSTIKLLSKTYNLKFDAQKNKKVERIATHSIYGLPVNSRPHNILWDLKKRCPIFTKTSKSKSFFCAGFYVVKSNNIWETMFCPKYITLNRYDYYGPYHLDSQAKLKLEELTNG